MTGKRNPKEVTLGFARKQQVQRVRGRQDGGQQIHIKTLLGSVSGTTQSVTLLLTRIDEEREKGILANLKSKGFLTS